MENVAREEGESLMEGIRHSTTHPKFLKSNSTSHKWVFGAIAELVDNSLDARATKFSIDIEPKPSRAEIEKWAEQRRAKLAKSKADGVDEIEATPADTAYRMIIQDNGTGMDPAQVHRMVSFGHCNKDLLEIEENRKFIGHYGNGFKSGSMRIGKDALVFSKDGKYHSIGFLSQTFLDRVKADEIFVPIVSFIMEQGKQPTPVLDFRVGRFLKEGTPEYERAIKTHNKNLQYILEYSPYNTFQQLQQQLDCIEETGTRVIIYNLKKREGAKMTKFYEFLFDWEEHDLIATSSSPVEFHMDKKGQPPENYSLKAYLALLYLDPKMMIYVMGQRINSVNIYAMLWRPAQYTYKMKNTSQPVQIAYGFNKQNRHYFGVHLYNKGRLIRMYMRIGWQLSPDSRGYGVLGVINADYLQPTHNKQDFITDDNYRRLITAAKEDLHDYWKKTIEDIKKTEDTKSPIATLWKLMEAEQAKGPFWVQCTKCFRWRKTEIFGALVDPEWKCDKLPFCSCELDQEEIPIPRVKKDKKRKAEDSEVIEDDDQPLKVSASQSQNANDGPEDSTELVSLQPKSSSSRPTTPRSTTRPKKKPKPTLVVDLISGNPNIPNVSDEEDGYQTNDDETSTTPTTTPTASIKEKSGNTAREQLRALKAKVKELEIALEEQQRINQRLEMEKNGLELEKNKWHKKYKDLKNQQASLPELTEEPVPNGHSYHEPEPEPQYSPPPQINAFPVVQIKQERVDDSQQQRNKVRLFNVEVEEDDGVYKFL